MAIEQLPYQQTMDQIYDLQRFAIKLGLDNILALTHFLKDPHLKYPVIHIAGTNGKGSTAYFLAKFLQSAGLKVGLFTSPHLVDFRERITINDRMIEQNYICDFWGRVKNLVMQRKATFFDTSTAMALNYFHDQSVDIAVIETGLGGRLDSTNIVNPDLVVITPIDFDHEKQLGNTLTKIAAEKAAIIKSKCPVFTGIQDNEAMKVLTKTCANGNLYRMQDFVQFTIEDQSLQGTTISFQENLFNEQDSSLYIKQLGSYQIENILLAYLSARHYLKHKKYSFDMEQFKNILSQFTWRGRLDRVAGQPDVFFDVSHNATGIEKTVRFLKKYVSTDSIHLLIGLVKDKNYRRIAEVVGHQFCKITVTEPPTHRKLNGFTLAEILKETHPETFLMHNPFKAYNFARQNLKASDKLLVIGSHYLIGALINQGVKSFDKNLV
ncbi:MAG: hypothetical protein GF313_16520 [Caldithrix sp.]|nr:hypothetical protein [Caldithrix sp.]